MTNCNFFYIINPQDVIAKAQENERGLIIGKGNVTYDVTYVDLGLLVGSMDIPVLPEDISRPSPAQSNAWVQGYHAWAEKNPPEFREQRYY